MKTLMNKLRSHAGETLVEAMAAILVFTLASIMLFTMVNAASTINKQALKSDAEVSAELYFAEEKRTPESSGECELLIGSSPAEKYEVNIFRSAPGALYSYSFVSVKK